MLILVVAVLGIFVLWEAMEINKLQVQLSRHYGIIISLAELLKIEPKDLQKQILDRKAVVKYSLRMMQAGYAQMENMGAKSEKIEKMLDEVEEKANSL